MSDEVLKTLLTSFPQVVFLILITAAAFVVLREFRAIRRELSDEIQTRIRGEMGALVGDVQKHVAFLQSQVSDASQLQSALNADRAVFDKQLAEARAETTSLVDGLRQETEIVRKLIPAKEELSWISPRTLVLQAKAASNWQDAYRFLAVMDDANSTSKDLELAGDICRDHRFFERAIGFYEKAVARDPQNMSALAELLGLKAEFRATERDSSLKQLSTLAAQELRANRDIAGRYFNALIELDRYDEMGTFCESHADDTSLPAGARALILRNLAISHRHSGRTEAARAVYARALEALPENENTLNAYSIFLREVGLFDEAADLYGRLIEKDALDARYYYGLAEVKEKQGHLAAAENLLQVALSLATGSQRIEMQQRLAGLEGRIRWKAIKGDVLAADSAVDIGKSGAPRTSSE